MLHLRDRLSLDGFGQWLSGSDPGLLRLQMAARGTLSVLLTTLACMALARGLGVSPIECAPGIVFSLVAPFLMREPTLRQRRRTLLIMTFPAMATAVLTTLLHGHGQAGPAAFLVVVFGGFLLQARSPRGVGLGLVAVVGMYVGLYLRLPVASLPTQLLSNLLAVPVTALACFVVVPMRPAWTFRRTLHAVQVLAAAAVQPQSRAQRHRSLARLNEAALAADDQLRLLAPSDGGPLRLCLVDLELAVARTMESEGAADGVARAAAALDAAVLAPTPLMPLAAPVPPGPLAWRVAFRVTLASALAMAGGMALSEQRWFWAVITTYVVFLGARSRGDTMVKGAQRLGGTVLGLVAGLLLASLVGGDPVLTVLGLLGATFGMYYTFLVSYTQGIFCVTVLLGLLYSAMGSGIESLLVLRLEETVIGTVAAVAVALLVLPARTRDQVARSGQAVLAGVAEVVRCRRLSWSGEPGPAPLDAMRALDRKVADLRLALVPLVASGMLLRRSALERPVPALLDCVHLARMLSVTPAGGPEAAAQAARIESRLAQLAAEPGALPAPVAGAGGVLGQLDQAVTVLAERLAIRVHDGFALEG